MMNAVYYTKYGDPKDVMAIKNDVPLPVPKPKTNQIRVKIIAVSVNSYDWDLVTGGRFSGFMSRIVNGLSGAFSPSVCILGCDVCGRVDKVAEGYGDTEGDEGTNKFKVGDIVFADLSEAGWGGFAEYVVADAKYFCRWEFSADPTSERCRELAAIPQAGALALQALRLGSKISAERTKQGAPPDLAGLRVLFNGACGGVGTIGANLAQHFGAAVVAGVDSGAKMRTMFNSGMFHEMTDYEKHDFVDGCTSEDKAKCFDIIIDCVAKRPWKRVREALHDGGVYVVIGTPNLGMTVRDAMSASMCPSGPVDQRKRFEILMFQPNVADLNLLGALLHLGEVRPVIDDEKFMLPDVPAALDKLGGGKVVGKAVINVSEA